MASLILAAGSGCGGAGITAADYCRAASLALARRTSECMGGTVDIRLDELKLDCDALARAAAAKRVRFDRQAAEVCTRELADLSCQQLDDLIRLNESFFPRVGACFGLATAAPATGMVATGGACSDSWDCQTGWCNKSSGCPGVCTAWSEPGASCLADSCASGSQCIIRCLACGAHCESEPVATKGEGESCDGVPCQYGLYCSYADSGHPVCKPGLTSGPCSGDDQCAPHYYCGAQGCTPQKLLGQACASATDCELGLDCSGGTCVAPPRVGEPCPSGHCLGLAFCDGRMCRAHCDVVPSDCLPVCR